ncbi:MAG: HAD-IB family phosphatase [Candidatus Moranbacteria bacterium]|jgi:HAD superfamily hydrolase (TIGR01490 family)|nr:HAD-IB family phosphatase [Candidatus Moranbacteria bacterium]
MTKKNKVAIFDIDGTIFRKNLHYELIVELAWMKVFPKDVLQQLREVYTNWIEHIGTYEDYRRSLVALYSEHIKGCSEEDVLKAARAVVPFHERRTYIFAEDLIKHFRKEGYHLIAISGSPIEIVKEYNESYLKFDQVFGSVYEKDAAGLHTGRASFEPSKNKGDIVKQYVFDHELTLDDSYGIGDTESDISFLQLVTHPVAFNPNQNLKAAAEDAGWRIVVEKKDVIYEIDPKSVTKNK